MALGLLYFTPYLNTSLRPHKSKTDILEDCKSSLLFCIHVNFIWFLLKQYYGNANSFLYCLAHHFDTLQLNRRRPTTIFLLCSPYKYWDLVCVTLFFHLPLSSSRHHIERNTISSNCKNTSFFLKVKILDDIASPFLPLSHEIKMIIYQK